jgi:hypothetical protein
MKRIFKVALLVLVSVLLLLLFLLIDMSPTVEKNVQKQVENAENVTELISQVRKSFRNRHDSQQIDITYSQAESLLGFTQRALPNMSSDIKMYQQRAEILVSYQLPPYLLSSYVNVSIKVNEAPGMELESVSIGLITIPGSWALSWAESLANSYTNSEVATQAIRQIAKTEISPEQVVIILNPLDPLLKELKNVNTSGQDENRHVLRMKTAHYLRLLAALPVPSNSGRQNKDTSLSYYLHKVMREAKMISDQAMNSNTNTAALENEAAIIAVAIYAGHRRFSTLFGDLTSEIDPVPTIGRRPVLANRQDLSLHFIFSAAIKLLSEQGISVAVGEFKELMDRGNGGSGYSFVDLAADMAGARFAALAVDPTTAVKLQSIMSMEANEALFFPSINGFEEGMNKSEFRQRFTDIKSEEYLSVVHEIERRIEKLPIVNVTNY